MNTQLAYDTDASRQVQNDVTGIIGRLEAVMDDRNAAVAAAMGDFQATGVSDDYAGVESRWQTAAGQVKDVITLVTTTLARNDDAAGAALAKAAGIVRSGQ